MKVIGTRLDSVSYATASDRILQWTKVSDSHYVCIANVHMLMEAHDSPKFRDIVNNADLITPDGIPLVWMMRAKGQRAQTRVYGPTLMLHVLEAAVRENLAVGFYGSKPEVLNMLVKRMQAKYQGLKVSFLCSPPFRELSQSEDNEIIQKINDSGVQIMFVGLGCPKQEKWMAVHRGKIQAVMIGVGAAFDFHAGVKAQAPLWMQKVGLEWLFRFVTEPRRLWRRYLYHNPRFIFLAVADLLGLLR